MKKTLTLILIFLLIACSYSLTVKADEEIIPDNHINGENIIIWDVEEIIKPASQVDFIIGYNVRESNLRTDYSYKAVSPILWRTFLESNYLYGYACELAFKIDSYGLYCEDSAYKYRLYDSLGLVVQPNDLLKDGEYYYTERFHESYVQIITPLGEESYSFEKGMLFKDWADSEYCNESYHNDSDLGIIKLIDGKVYLLCDSSSIPVRRFSKISDSEVYVLERVINQKFAISRVVEIDEYIQETLIIEYEYMKYMTFQSWLSSVYCYPDEHGEPIIENGEIKFYTSEGVYALYNSKMEKVKLYDFIQAETYYLVFERNYI